MFLMIFEDGTVWKSETFDDDDKGSCNDGILDVIDTSTMMSFYDDKWNEIPSWEI